MATVTVHETEEHIARMLDDVEAGKEFVIVRGSRPFAKLVPIEDQPKVKRVPGRYAGQFSVPDDAFAPMSEEELALWYGDDAS